MKKNIWSFLLLALITTACDKDKNDIEDNKTTASIFLVDNLYYEVVGSNDVAVIHPPQDVSYEYTNVYLNDEIIYKSNTYKITKIGEDAFASDYYLTEANTGNNVTEILSNAFDGCNKLTKITIGQEISYIGSMSFRVGNRF